MGISVIDNHINGINFANELCCSIFTAVILVALLFKKYRNAEIKAFIYFCFCSLSAMWTDSICYMCGSNAHYKNVMYVMTVISYAFSAFSACTFFTYIMAYFEERKNVRYPVALKIIALVYSGIISFVYATSVWTDRFFYVDSNGVYQSTPYTDIIGRMILPLVIASTVVILLNIKITTKRDTIIHIMYTISYIVLGYIDTVYTMSFHYIAMTVLVIVIFIFISQERDKELEIKQKELAISELNALRLQMNPHFVYNTLASIDGLVVIDPNEARALIAKFTKHLRSSYLDNSPNKVSFETELENIKCYLSVEEVRFPNINVEYDLKTTNFSIPPLTVQPIIENAIKHGICKKDDSTGTISITTYDDTNNHYINICDDGVGFDTSAVKKDDGRSHIGIANTEKRLKLICDGSLKITSEIGAGTQALITIPKEKI